MDKVKAIVKWLQNLEPWWFSKYSFINESIGGAAWYLIPTLVVSDKWSLVISIVGRTAYELFADPWGWNDDDVVQSVIGSFAAYLLTH